MDTFVLHIWIAPNYKRFLLFVQNPVWCNSFIQSHQNVSFVRTTAHPCLHSISSTCDHPPSRHTQPLEGWWGKGNGCLAGIGRHLDMHKGGEEKRSQTVFLTYKESGRRGWTVQFKAKLPVISPCVILHVSKWHLTCRGKADGLVSILALFFFFLARMSTAYKRNSHLFFKDMAEILTAHYLDPSRCQCQLLLGQRLNKGHWGVGELNRAENSSHNSMRTDNAFIMAVARITSTTTTLWHRMATSFDD